MGIDIPFLSNIVSPPVCRLFMTMTPLYPCRLCFPVPSLMLLPPRLPQSLTNIKSFYLPLFIMRWSLHRADVIV